MQNYTLLAGDLYTYHWALKVLTGKRHCKLESDSCFKETLDGEVHSLRESGQFANSIKQHKT
jgi:hypothetical protein